jgi:hypothetical protein
LLLRNRARIADGSEEAVLALGRSEIDAGLIHSFAGKLHRRFGFAQPGTRIARIDREEELPPAHAVARRNGDVGDEAGTLRAHFDQLRRWFDHTCARDRAPGLSWGAVGGAIAGAVVWRSGCEDITNQIASASAAMPTKGRMWRGMRMRAISAGAPVR